MCAAFYIPLATGELETRATWYGLPPSGDIHKLYNQSCCQPAIRLPPPCGRPAVAWFHNGVIPAWLTAAIYIHDYANDFQKMKAAALNLEDSADASHWQLYLWPYHNLIVYFYVLVLYSWGFHHSSHGWVPFGVKEEEKGLHPNCLLHLLHHRLLQHHSGV